MSDVADEWQVPDGFPSRLSDDELAEALQRMTVVPRTSRFASTNTSLQAALIQVGVADQQRRHTEATSKSSRTIAFASLVIALTALLLSVGFGALDYYGDQDWQEQRTRLLTEIRDRIATP